MYQTDALGSLVLILVGIAILVFVFALIRSVLLWYFKVDETVALLKRIAEAIEKFGGRDLVPCAARARRARREIERFYQGV